MALNWQKVSNRLISNARSLNRPISASFELTCRCNLKCRMCYVAEHANNKDIKDKELSASQWIKLAEMVRDAGVLFVTLTGGEVLLRKDFREIYEAIASMGFITQIYTNGTLITPEIAQWLGKMPPLQVSLTVYGASAETYGKVCGNADGFDRVVNGIKLLREQGINLEIKTTAVRDNWREFEQIGALAKKYGAIFGVVNYISPRREGCGTDPVVHRLTPEQVVEHDALRMAYNKANASTARVVNDEYEKDIIPVLNDIHDDENDAFFCQAGKSGIWLAWDGRMTPCGLMSEPSVDLLENGMEKAWEMLRDGCRQIPVCWECRQCDIRDNCFCCPARLKLETGKYDKPAPYLCEMARLREDAEAVGSI